MAWAILVGHSYGGAVISEAGTHENVAGLVYITAFAPDTGESVQTLIGTFPQDGAAAADPAAGGRVPAARPGQVRSSLRGRSAGPGSRLHGRLADALGTGG